MPIVLVASEKMRKAIEQICLQLARTYKHKIIDLVPELCRRCEITEADQVFDNDQMAEKISDLAANEKDQMFIRQFACSQMFSVLLENYLAALNQRQQERDTGGGLALSR